MSWWSAAVDFDAEDWERLPTVTAQPRDRCPWERQCVQGPAIPVDPVYFAPPSGKTKGPRNPLPGDPKSWMTPKEYEQWKRGQDREVFLKETKARERRAAKRAAKKWTEWRAAQERERAEHERAEAEAQAKAQAEKQARFEAYAARIVSGDDEEAEWEQFEFEEWLDDILWETMEGEAERGGGNG